MTITAEQIVARRKHIGASDAPAILGMDIKRCAYDVWLEKTADIEPDEGNEAMDAGNRVEPLLLDYAAEQLGCLVEVSPPTVTAPCGIIAANLDGIARFRDGTEAVVEAKSSGNADGWGEPGTDQVPDRVIVQTHVQMLVTGFQVAYVPVLLANYGLRFRLYRVDRNSAVVTHIADELRRFWREHVETRVPPIGTLPNLDLLRRMRRAPGTVVDVGDQGILETWNRAVEARKSAEKDEDEARAALLAAMGQAEGARFPDGSMATYLAQKRRGFDAKRICEEHPEFTMKYKTETTFRVLRHKGAPTK